MLSKIVFVQSGSHSVFYGHQKAIFLQKLAPPSVFYGHICLNRRTHMAWSGCIIGNPSEAGYPASGSIIRGHDLVLMYNIHSD